MEHAYRNFTDEKTGEMELFIFPVVAETFNGYLNDQSKFAVTPEHIIRGVNKATADRVPEGNTGGGTAMLCHRYKGGTGSSSRTINGYDIGGNPATYTVGVLVQVNYSSPENLHVGGIPLGRILKEPEMEIASLKDSGDGSKEPRKDGSIIHYSNRCASGPYPATEACNTRDSRARQGWRLREGHFPRLFNRKQDCVPGVLNAGTERASRRPV